MFLPLLCMEKCDYLHILSTKSVQKQHFDVQKSKRRLNSLFKYILTYVLSIVDLLLTRVWVRKFGLQHTEANPIGIILLTHPIVAYAWKIGVVGAFIYILYKTKDIPISKIGINMSLTVFLLLIWYHLFIIVKVIGIYKRWW